jgi:hypothetical protein
MKILRLYADRKGESHFEEVEIPLNPAPGNMWNMSRRFSGKGLILGESTLRHEVHWELAPRRQYLVNLDTPVEITASDGEARLIELGDIVLMEDTKGKGHISRPLARRARRSVFIPIE